MQVRDGKDKFARNAQAAGGDYLEGVKSPKRDWEESTKAAEANYEAGVQEAIGRKAFGKGVGAAGNEAHRKGVETVGRQRYQQGVAVSGDKYARGFAPYKSKLESLTLAPRGPKGTNYTRVQEVGDALRKEKIS